MSVPDLLETAAILAGSHKPPGTTPAAGGGDLPSVFANRLQQTTGRLPSLSTATTTGDLKSRFSLASLECLCLLHAAVLATPGPSGELGTLDMKLVNTLLQLVISLGVYPALEPNVGVSLDSRTRFAGLANIDAGDKEDNLRVLCRATLQMAALACDARTTVISRDLSGRYLPDLLGALLQLLHSAVNTDSHAGCLTVESVAEVSKSFDTVFESVDAHNLLEALLTLMRSRPPAWLKARCTTLLSQILQRPRGVRTALECLLPPSEAFGTLDTAQLEHVAKVIASVPKTISPPDYFANVCTQLLLLMKNSSKTSTLFRASTYCIVHIINRRPAIGKRYLLNELLSGLLPFHSGAWVPRGQEAGDFNNIGFAYEVKCDLDGRKILVNETHLNATLENLRYLLVGNDSSPVLIHALASVVPALYYMQDFAAQTGSSVRQPALEILLIYFRIADAEEGGRVLWRVMVETLQQQDTAVFARGSEGGLVLVEGQGQRLTPDLDRFIEFLDEINNDDVAGEFFLRLMDHHGDDLSEDDDQAAEKLYRTQLILCIMGRYGERIIKKPAQIVSFSKNMLLSEDDEMLSLGIALVSAVLSNDETPITSEMQASFKDILVILQTHSTHENAEIRELARELRVLIVTRGTSLTDFSDADSKALHTAQETLDEALKELGDDLVPVRAHGMHLIRGLVLSKDPVLRERLAEVTGIFLDQLKDEDSFIYLNAVKGLSSLTDVYPGETLSGIASRYNDSALELDYRLRVGEALLQTIQRCGEAFAKYSPKILPPILHVLHSPTTELRSSALSLLATAAETSPFALFPFLQQIADYIRNLLLLETKTPETRRGAVVLLLGLIRGLGVDLFRALDAREVEAIGGQLEVVEATDADELTRLHARTALADLADIANVRLGI
ncbi:transmembrane and coiled-coil domains-containing protein 7 [Geranomyces variabilis]|uniref:Transmembrane and coiled-coil domains-containing protein 7 n=1 Tax=Geranomyces variabilis TaxID=109894 RepID=A0AAD5TEW8_9FUNG|nr:transmembrane and coiled-coil domains-containing protein 7 [Geranomyces variabilis]